MTEEKTGSIVRKPKSKKNYINGPDFYKALVDYNEKLNENKDIQIPRYIGECIFQIANKLSNKFNFINYSFKEEMVLSAIEKMVEKVHCYDVDYNKENPNPFAYFTQIAWNIFIQTISKEEKQSYTKHKNFERLFSLDDLNEFGDSFNNEEHNKVIEKFEIKNKNNSKGYSSHKNLDYSKNKVKKIKKEEQNAS